MNRRSEHLLEKLYLNRYEEFSKDPDVHYLGSAAENSEEEERLTNAAAAELIEKGYAVRKNGDIQITPEGEIAARDMTRRYRLAERLLHDLLQVKGNEISERACEMEHILSPAVTDSICTLLGHPPVCPHNKPIPPGDCCKGDVREVKPVVISLAEARVGTEGKISFISSRTTTRIDRMSSMGISPGCKIKLIQKKNTPVIQAGGTVVAIESDIAREIFIRVEKTS